MDENTNMEEMEEMEEQKLEEQEPSEKTVSQQQIAEWKMEWGKIFKTSIGNQPFIWRKLKRKEYVNIMSSGEGTMEAEKFYERQEMIAQATVLFPENIEEVIEDDAGVATALADEILLKSGFDITTTEEL